MGKNITPKLRNTVKAKIALFGNDVAITRSDNKKLL